MARVVSMFAWRRIFCAIDGWTFARASSVAVVCRSEWKTMPFFGSGRIQRARLSFGQRRFALSSAFSTWSQAWLAATMLVALDHASPAERSPQDGLEVRLRGALLAVRCGEDPLRGRQLDGRVEVRPQRLGNRHRAIVPALRDIGIVRAAHRDRPVAQVDVFLLQSQQLAAAQAKKEGRGEQRPPLRRQSREHARHVFRRDGRALAPRLLELR